jgi:hypothetical protein
VIKAPSFEDWSDFHVGPKLIETLQKPMSWVIGKWIPMVIPIGEFWEGHLMVLQGLETDIKNAFPDQRETSHRLELTRSFDEGDESFTTTYRDSSDSVDQKRRTSNFEPVTRQVEDVAHFVSIPGVSREEMGLTLDVRAITDLGSILNKNGTGTGGHDGGQFTHHTEDLGGTIPSAASWIELHFSAEQEKTKHRVVCVRFSIVTGQVLDAEWEG